MELTGKKVRLTKVSAEDLDFIGSIECQEELWYYEEHVESDENIVKADYLRKIEENGEAGSHDFVVSLVSDPTHTPIGLAQIWSYVDHRNSYEMGFAILKEHWGHGYGSEAAALLLKFAFGHLDAHKVVGMCNSRNSRSAALMERLGMTREAVFKEELYWQDQWVDQYFYSILDREYPK